MPVNSKSFFQPIDRVAIAVMLGLSLLIGLVLWQGNAVAPRVRDFSWQNQQVGATDNAFTLTFSRPMDTKSVEANLQIDPPLPGKFSWAGRKMAYTLLTPAPYGNSYQVQLHSARERFGEAGEAGRQMQPFSRKFRTRDRAFVYLGVDGEEQGRLVLYNLTEDRKTILTPKDLVVVDFKPYPSAKKVLFSATERINDSKTLLSSQIYTVTTGINYDIQEQDIDNLPGRIDLVVDNQDYQNLKFDLSPDGQTIVVQRVSQANLGEFGLWMIRSSDNQDVRPTPQPIKAEAAGDFIITPDSAAVAVAQGQGVAILPLQPDATKPLDFLPQFGTVLEFSQNGSQAAMVKYNPDYTRSLFLVSNQGTQQELLRTTGSILSCKFDPLSPKLYCLLTQLLGGDEYQEQPYLATVDLNTGKQTPLVVLPNQRDVQISLSPDGLALLLDQVVTATDTNNPPRVNIPRTNEGEAIATSRLWIIPLVSPQSGMAAQIKPKQLPLPGFHPRWLP